MDNQYLEFGTVNIARVNPTTSRTKSYKAKRSSPEPAIALSSASFTVSSLLVRALLHLLIGQESCFSSSISHQNTPLLGRLNEGLVVTTNSVANRDKTKLCTEHITMFGGEFQQAFGKSVVVLLLLQCIIESRIMQILFSIGDQELLELKTKQKGGR